MRSQTEGQLQPFAVVAPNALCDSGTANIVIHDDGVAENGYGWNVVANVGRNADKFTPAAYPATISTVCAGFITNTGVSSFNFNLVVYAPDGTGAPGVVLGTKALVAHPMSMSGVPVTPTFEVFDISDLAINVTSGSVFISVEWDASVQPGGVFIAADESSGTPLNGGFMRAGTDPWSTIVSQRAAYRALFLRAVMPLAGPGAPSVSKAFAPAQMLAGETSTLTIALNNTSQPTAAVLSAALTDTFPAGLVVASPPAASTTCTGGTATATAGGGSVSLNSGASIPASGSCTIKVNVTAAADGSYVNTIPADALKTQHGNNAGAASATLKIGFTFPEPYCGATFPSAVEPITHVLFGGIDNVTSAALNGSPALENFTAMLGTVAPGGSYPMAVEGNTDGTFTNKIVAYIDWNQNGVFTDSGERYVIGDLVNSTGADGIQAVADIAVPGSATPGQTRMRVTKRYSVEADPCNSVGWGQAEDYTLTVGTITGDPKISVTPAAVSGSAAVGATTTQALTIKNIGGGSLTWTVAEAPSSHMPPMGSRPDVPVTHPNTAIALLKQAPNVGAGSGSTSSAALPAAAGTAYAIVNNVNDYVSFDPAAPAAVTHIGVASGTVASMWGGGFVSGDASVHYLLGDTGLKKYTTATRAVSVVNAATGAGDVWAATVDPSSGKMYYVGPSAAQKLFSVDLATGTATAVGTISGAAAGHVINALAADASGNLWAVDKTNDTLVAINKTTAASSLVGALGFDTEFVGSLAFGGDGILYFAAPIVTGDNSMYTLNTTTGTGTLIGALPQQVEAMAFVGGGVPVTPCSSPADVPWLSATPAGGTTAGGGSSTVTVGLNAAGLAEGVHTANLCVSSNDITNPLVVVPVSFTVTSGTVTPNGIIYSAPLNHAIARTTVGTSMNIVSSAFDDGGPTSGNWDFNFWDSSGLTGYLMPGNGGTYAVDGSGNAIVLHAGDTVGPGLTFPAPSSSTRSVPFVAAWRAGTEAYLGVRFNCSGRLTNPVTGPCYGYVRIKTTGPTGFPATILDTAFDGDGQPLLIDGPVVPVDPVANITPAGGFDFSVDAGSTGTDTLVIGNTGGGNLTWSIAERDLSRLNPPSYKTAAAALASKYNPGGIDPLATLERGTAQGNNRFGDAFPLAAMDISQMTDNAPGDEGVACNANDGSAIRDNSWWRRFYFNEHPQVGGSAAIQSVTISTGSVAIPGGLPSTINLYTLAHSTAVDTIPTGALTLIGTTTTTVNGTSVSVTIPVTGTVSNTAGLDLVVEWFTPGATGGVFYPGANASAETHPTFMSSAACGIANPTRASAIGSGFPDFHLTMVVTLDDGGTPPPGCENPVDVPWLSTNPSSGSVAGGSSSNVAVTVNAGTLPTGTYSAELCVTTNDLTHALVRVPVSMTVGTGPVVDGIFCSGFEMDEDGSCGGPVVPDPFTQPLQDPSFETATSDGGTNTFWAGTDSNDPAGGTPFYSNGAHTGSMGVWFGGWRATAETQTFSQSVTIASGGPRFINYWRNVTRTAVGSATLKVYVDGAAVETTDIVANGLDADWTNKSVDISSYGNNAPHTIKFEYVTAGADDGNVFIDDVTIDEQAGSARSSR